MESAIVYLKLRMKKFLKFVVVLPISIGPVWKSIEGFVVVPHLCAWMKYLTELGNTTRSSTSPQCNRPQMGVLPITAIQKNQYKKYDKDWVIVFSQRFYFTNQRTLPNLFLQKIYYREFVLPHVKISKTMLPWQHQGFQIVKRCWSGQIFVLSWEKLKSHVNNHGNV